ncbi:hypothetical protein QCA50_010453 [Cerrena zonata]|uniref:AB hydrolase-1 domain-containing protein n=1 Tax=Cerrena zonata TaxID=2478898 RepID=A0AAW0FYT1_9APHY
MPIASVTDGPIHLYYEDTGPPTEGFTDVYTTVILLHGAYWTSGIFRPLIPHAKKHNLRLVLLNQRGYPGSSPFADKEIAAMQSEDLELQRAFTREQGHIYGQVISTLIETLDIPSLCTTQDEKLEGGVCFLAWSSGNECLFQLLSALDTLPEQSRITIENHLRSVVIYEPPMYASGTCPPFVLREADNRSSGLWSPVRDPNCFHQLTEYFSPWCSSYYSPIENLPSLDPKDYDATYTLMHERKILNTAPTYTRLTEDICFKDFITITSNALRIVPELFREHVLRSLTRLEEDQAWQLHSRFKLVLLWCEHTLSESLLGTSAISQYHEELKSNGVLVREMEVGQIGGANHFAHSDDPEGFVQFLVKHC